MDRKSFVHFSTNIVLAGPLCTDISTYTNKRGWWCTETPDDVTCPRCIDKAPNL